MGGSHIFSGTACSAENVGIKDPENQLVPEVVKQMLQYSSGLSAKSLVLLSLLKHWQQEAPGDRVVVVSNFSRTLRRLLRVVPWKSTLLSGDTAPAKRMAAVEGLNTPGADGTDLLLLSSKAGGTGLNLIGANRLILFDPDWNPANDAQAMARIWREGQTKPCFIYRFVLAGTLEEKICQRQQVKTDLAHITVDGQDMDSAGAARLSWDELRRVFALEGYDQNGLPSHMPMESAFGPRCGAGSPEGALLEAPELHNALLGVHLVSRKDPAETKTEETQNKGQNPPLGKTPPKTTSLAEELNRDLPPWPPSQPAAHGGCPQIPPHAPVWTPAPAAPTAAVTPVVATGQIATTATATPHSQGLDPNMPFVAFRSFNNDQLGMQQGPQAAQSTRVQEMPKDDRNPSTTSLAEELNRDLPPWPPSQPVAHGGCPQIPPHAPAWTPAPTVPTAPTAAVTPVVATGPKATTPTASTPHSQGLDPNLPFVAFRSFNNDQLGMEQEPQAAQSTRVQEPQGNGERSHLQEKSLQAQTAGDEMVGEMNSKPRRKRSVATPARSKGGDSEQKKAKAAEAKAAAVGSSLVSQPFLWC